MAKPFYTRKVAILRFTYNDFSKRQGAFVEDAINTKIEDLLRNGKKVVSIQSQTMGLSPIYMIYTIVYEDVIPDAEEGERDEKTS